MDPGTWRGGGREEFGGIRGAGRPGTEAFEEGKGKPGREEAWEEASAGIGSHPGSGWESHWEASGDRMGVPEWSIFLGYSSRYRRVGYYSGFDPELVRNWSGTGPQVARPFWPWGKSPRISWRSPETSLRGPSSGRCSRSWDKRVMT